MFKLKYTINEEEESGAEPMNKKTEKSVAESTEEETEQEDGFDSDDDNVFYRLADETEQEDSSDSEGPPPKKLYNAHEFFHVNRAWISSAKSMAYFKHDPKAGEETAAMKEQRELFEYKIKPTTTTTTRAFSFSVCVYSS